METPLESTTPKTEIILSMNLLAKETAHTLQNTVFLGVVRVVFAWNLENGGKWVGERVYRVADPLCNL